eukprot:CAMPEP_0173446014 /NCGR_PEP_ID=MMETSP1357-20121228/35644_1 /TAXON_ID=77926 /ORGANISM="Hemiselmis rufescens, Strain PCC563" /LENGTH=170 /DNA_ID=CAMNT_0014412273 /DNA_START=15 /DNA_END=523 /DNA_ORIENTATION=+
MKDPEALKRTQQMMQSMKPEQFAQMMNQREGSNRWTAAMAKEHLEMLKDPSILEDAKNMSESEIEMGIKTGLGGLGRGSGPGGTPTVPAAAPPAPPGMAMPQGMDPKRMSDVAAQMRENPNMLKQASEMMKNMDPEVVAKMLSAQSPGITPEMAKMSTQMMANMSEEQMA